MKGGKIKGGNMKGGKMNGGKMNGGKMKGGKMKGGKMKGGKMKGGIMKRGIMKKGKIFCNLNFYEIKIIIYLSFLRCLCVWEGEVITLNKKEQFILEFMFSLRNAVFKGTKEQL